METCLQKDESKLLFCSQQNLWMLLLQTMVEKPSESKKLTISFLHFCIKHFPSSFSNSLQQEHCWLQHNSGFWKRKVYSASHAHVWVTHPGFVGIILNIILPSTDYNGATWSRTRYPPQPTACWEFSCYSAKFQGECESISRGFQGGGESTSVGLACWGLR